MVLYGFAEATHLLVVCVYCSVCGVSLQSEVASGTSSSHHRVGCTEPLFLQAVARHGPWRVAIVASVLARSIQGGAVHFCDHHVSFLERYCVLNSDDVRELSRAGVDACNLAPRDRLVLCGDVQR